MQTNRTIQPLSMLQSADINAMETSVRSFFFLFIFLSLLAALPSNSKAFFSIHPYRVFLLVAHL